MHEFISTDKGPLSSVCRTERFWRIFIVNSNLCMDVFHICLFLTVAFPDNIHVCVLKLFKITIKKPPSSCRNIIRLLHKLVKSSKPYNYHSIMCCFISNDRVTNNTRVYGQKTFNEQQPEVCVY